MLPENPEVVLSQRAPSLVGADETRIEAIDLWRRSNLRCAAGVEWPPDLRDVGFFQYLEVVPDRHVAHSARGREFGRFKDPAALRKQEAREFNKGMPILQTEEFLNILGPIIAQPLLKSPGRKIARKKEGWKSSMVKPGPDLWPPEISQILTDHGSKVHHLFAAGQRVPELGGGRQGRGACCHDLKVGVIIGRNLKELRRIIQQMDLIDGDAPGSRVILEKAFGVFHLAPCARQLTVKEFSIRQGA